MVVPTASDRVADMRRPASMDCGLWRRVKNRLAYRASCEKHPSWQQMLGRKRGWGHVKGAVKKDFDSAVSKILVIDDEDGFRQVLIKFLSREGFEVEAASDGKAGVDLATETQPDLIVCDLNMPGMDGYEVLAALRRDPKLADIPLIFLTGQSQPSQVRQGMNFGADDYLTKPVNLTDLLGAIRVRLGHRQAQQQRQEKQMERAMQLFGGIVHDLRDPLFVVLGYTGILKGGPGQAPAGGKTPRQILDRMQQAVLRMQAIISETLFLTRSRMQRLPFDPGPFDLRDFCEQMVADHEENQRVRFQCVAGRFPVVADSLRLRQALDNLLSNALKYSDAPVVVSLSAGSQDYLIEVRDQGIGIPADDQAGIFEPFFRASNTGSRPGHGLGLSIVKSCIEQHGGTIRFRSEGGQGTTFFLELPKAPLAMAAAHTGVLPSDDRTNVLANHPPETRLTAAAASSKPGDSFLVKTLTEKRLVKVNEIERIVAYGEYSWVYWQKNKKGALLRKSLKQWLSELPGEQFIRVHRRAIVNLACMERVEQLPNSRMQIHLRDTAEPILVSLRLAPVLNRTSSRPCAVERLRPFRTA
jgi:two-component system, sensor histidine kinase and response regulator